MTVFSDIEDSLYSVIHEAFPTWTAIFPYQNSKEPPTPYLLICVDKIDAIGMGDREGWVTNGQSKSGQAYEATVCFEIISDGAREGAEMCHSLDTFFSTMRCVELLRQNSLSYMQRGSTTRLAVPRDTDVFVSHQQKMVFGYYVTSTHAQDWVESIGIEGGITDAVKLPDHTINVTID